MIKKFEQFVNEMYSTRKEELNVSNKDSELVAYLTLSAGVEDKDAINNMLKQSRKVDFYYTAEEAENIFNRLPEHENNKYHRTYAAVNLFFTPNEEFDEYCRENNIPIVRDVKGKLLTGKVVYSDHFKQYGESEDDIIYMLDVAADKEGLTPEEYREQNRGKNILDVVEVDLDKEFGWKE